MEESSDQLSSELERELGMGSESRELTEETADTLVCSEEDLTRGPGGGVLCPAVEQLVQQ